MRQSTLKISVSISGVGVHSGQLVAVRLLPAPLNAGIVFTRTDIGVAIPVSPSAIQPMANRATCLGDGALIQTPEHLLAACFGLGVTNLRIEIDGPEVPILDGSAAPWCELMQGNLQPQEGSTSPIIIEKPLRIVQGSAEILVVPDSVFRVSYFLSYPDTIMSDQRVSIVVSPEVFATQIAPARTFGLKSELDALLTAGLAKGVTLDNALGVDGMTYMSDLRLEDEPARHKILDILGDFAILGRPIQAHIIGVGSGHQLNLEMVKQIATFL